MRAQFSTSPNSAEVSGFDHSSAVFNWYGIVGGVFPYLVVPALLALPWRTALLSSIGAAAMLALAMLPLRYRVCVSARSIVLKRSWAGYTYKRIEVPNGPRLQFLVLGTGDWNDEGVWPGAHYCEIVSPEQSELHIGTPGGAVEMAAWLSAQASRVACSDA